MELQQHMKGNIDLQTLEDNRQHVAEWLKKKREKKGWTHQELADRMGIRRPTVSDIEAAKWAISLDMLALFCEHLDIDLKKMFK